MTLASVAIERLAGIDPAAVAEGRIAYTMGAAEAHRLGRRGRRADRPAAGVRRAPARSDAGRGDRGRRRRRRRDAPEEHLHLPEGPDRPRDQPARVEPAPHDRRDARPDATLPPPPSRPVRKDEIELHDRGLYIESWLPERRSRRKPLLFVHGELGGSWAWERFLGYFAGRGWEGHALNLRNHHWSQTADAGGAFVRDPSSTTSAPRSTGSDRTWWRSVTAWAASSSLKAAERHAVAGLVLVASELPGDVREPIEPHRIREVPELFGPSLLGWATLPEKLQRDHRDLTLADVLRIQHLMGQKPHESGRARRTMLRGVRVDPAKLGDVPRLVIAGGLDRVVPLEASERLATWLGAEFDPFGAHSHYGLILGEEAFTQVADAIRSFLEAHRL